MLRITLALLLCLVVVGSIYSQLITDTLDQSVVITTHKVPIPTKQSNKPIIIIDSESIAASGVSDIAQLLDQQVGIRVNGSLSNPSLNRSTYVQGGGSESVLFMVDGMPLNDPSTIGGAFDIRNLSLAGIDRIEILKGSQSTLYGSNAISGVINIITKNSMEEGLKVSGQLSYASLTSQSQLLSGSYKTGNTTLNINGSYEGSDGISEAKNIDPNSVQFDSDGFERSNLNVDLVHKFGNRFSIRPFYRNNKFNSDFDAGSFTDSEDSYESFYHSLGLQSAFSTDRNDIRLLYSFTDTDRSFFSSFGPSVFNGSHHLLDVFDRVMIADNSYLTVGLNYQSFRMTDDGATVDDPSDSIISPYALYHALIGDFNGSAGLRYNSHSQYGTNVTYELAASYRLGSGFKVLANYSTGFKAPVLSQLYGAFGANPDLLPEESTYWTVGLNYIAAQDLFEFNLNYFDRNVDNIIVFGTDPITGAFGYSNQERQEDSGIEAQFTMSPDKLKFGVAYTRLTGRTLSEDGSLLSESLLRRPKNQVDISLDYTGIDRFTVGIGLNFTGERQDLFFDFNTFQTSEAVLERYNIATLRMSYMINDAFSIYGTMQNALNADFEEVTGFNNLGRYVLVGVRFDVGQN